MAVPCYGQAKKGKRSAAELKAIAAIKKSGGQVMELAQNDKRLEVAFHLADGKITDKELEPLSALKDVVHLNLRGTEVTDIGLERIGKIKTLTKLHLEKTKVTDAGLPHLMDLKNLEYLNLWGTEVTNAGIAQLAGMKKLKKLYIYQTKVDIKGVAEMKKRAPKLNVIPDLVLEKIRAEKRAKEEAIAKKKAAEEAAKKKKEDAKKKAAKKKAGKKKKPGKKKGKKKKKKKNGKWHFAKSAHKKGSAIEYRKNRGPNSVEMHTSISAHRFRAELPAGEYTVTVERGKEYLPYTKKVTIGARPVELTVKLRRWINMAARGWYSGDTHVHRTVAELPNAMLAEDLNVALPLTHWVTKAYTPPTQGDKNTDVADAARLIRVDDTHVIYPLNTEYEIFTVNGKRHTLGAVFVLNHKRPLPMGTPPVGPIAAAARKQGAILDLDKHSWPWSLMLVPVMNVDLFELSNNHVWRTEFYFKRWTLNMRPEFMKVETDDVGMTERGWVDFGFGTYYALLNCGFRMRPTAGTASGVHPVPLGFGRVYVHLKDGFSYDKWMAGLNAGRSFVTTGPMPVLEFNGRLPGHRFKLANGDAHHAAAVRGTIESAQPLSSIEIVVNGEVVRKIKPKNNKQKSGAYISRIDEAVRLEGTSWVAVRCFENRPGGKFRFAHTSPVWFDVKGKPLRPRRAEGFQEVLVHGGGGVTQTPDYWGNDYFGDTYWHNGVTKKYSGYCTDVFFDGAMKFIESAGKKPFFCYIPTNAAHGPFLVAKKYSEPYKKMGIPSPRAEFYGMITNIDENMARLRKKLSALGLEENTILIFMTDNGTAAGMRKGGFNAGMRGTKGSEYDGGHRVPFFIRWPKGGLTGGRDISKLTAHIDVLPTLAEFCGVNVTNAEAIDGMSLTPLLKKNTKIQWPARTITVHSQRVETPEKWRKAAVMTDRWRLVVNGDRRQLFDMKADPGQNKDVSKQHPDAFRKLTSDYEKWYRHIGDRFDGVVRIGLGSPKENPARLTCHDWHTNNKSVPWNQGHIKRDLRANGYWAVNITQAGTYEFTLRARPAGVAGGELRGGKARIAIGDQKEEVAIPDRATSVSFKLNLKPGPARLQTWFEESNGRKRGAYFVNVKYVKP
eukprot:g33042.t1